MSDFEWQCQGMLREGNAYAETHGEKRVAATARGQLRTDWGDAVRVDSRHLQPAASQKRREKTHGWKRSADREECNERTTSAPNGMNVVCLVGEIRRQGLLWHDARHGCVEYAN